MTECRFGNVIVCPSTVSCKSRSVWLKKPTDRFVAGVAGAGPSTGMTSYPVRRLAFRGLEREVEVPGESFAGDGTKLRASSLNLLADSDVKAKATTKAIAVGLAGAVNGGSAEAVVASDTEAFLGERYDTVRVTQADVQIRNGAGSPGTVNIDAISVAVEDAKNDGLAAALGEAVSVLLPKAKLSGTTRAYLGPRTTILAGSIDILAKDNEARAIASTEVGAAATVAVSVVDSSAKVSRANEAFVGHHANLILGGGSLTLTAWSPQVRAVSTTRGFSAALLADVAVFSKKVRWPLL